MSETDSGPSLSRTDTLQAAAVANGNGTVSVTDGYGTQIVQIAETGGGTATIALQGSVDGTTWFALGYELIDNTASPSRAVANISVLANSKHTYLVMDTQYPQVRAVMSAAAGGATVTVLLYKRP